MRPSIEPPLNCPKQHPYQTPHDKRKKTVIPQSVALAAYEVYCHCYSPQPALITNGCRGGFSDGELFAFLYARSFPREQWKEKVREVMDGMVPDGP